MLGTVTKHDLKPLRACLLGSALVAALSTCGNSEYPVLQVIPAPAAVEFARGSFRLADGARIGASDARAVPVAEYLAALLARTRGIKLEMAQASEPAGAVRLELGAVTVASPEAYALEVSGDGVVIRAADARGLFYGAVTLWQLATADGTSGGPASIPALRIEDAPRFAWRGLMLDSARHYQPPAFIRELIDWMALHKLNVLHWHLTDDQGWRLEIRKYPRLTEVGAWRVPAGSAWPRGPNAATGKPSVYGGFYSQAEVRDLVAFAASRYVTIVPEIEMPGHAQAAIASYAALGTGGAPPPVSPDWGVHDYLFNADDSTLAFLEDVLGEVTELFPGEFVHVGGDEAVKDRWKSSPRVQARLRELGLADEEALQGWFVARIGAFLDAHGRRLIGWDEILAGGVPARAAVMSWRGTDGAVAAASAGHDVVMAPSPTLYLDHWQSDSPTEPPGRPAIITLKEVYEYEPVPSGLPPEKAAHILGAQLNAWTEHMRLTERVEHQAFPRVAALAEATWSPAAARSWPGFEKRLGVQFARYRKLGIHFADSAFAPRAALTAGSEPGRLRVTLSQQSAFGELRYTLDGREPGPGSRHYDGPFEARAGDTLTAATFDGALLLGSLPPLAMDPALLRRRTDEELKPCSGNLELRLEDDAPLEGERAVFNVDIVDPCWIWPDAELARGGLFRAAVGQLPFNFQIGKEVEAIRRGDARTRDGELEVRTGDCRGDPVAVLPLEPAVANPTVSVLGPARIPPQAARGNLCLRFARPAIDPIWAVQWAEFGE
jgi:hexosaminidase